MKLNWMLLRKMHASERVLIGLAPIIVRGMSMFYVHDISVLTRVETTKFLIGTSLNNIGTILGGLGVATWGPATNSLVK